jgi:hypothetical protein
MAENTRRIYILTCEKKPQTAYKNKLQAIDAKRWANGHCAGDHELEEVTYYE